MSSRPHRILHIFADVNKGGAEARIMDLYRHIDRNNIQFDFLTMIGGEHHFDKEIAELGGRKFLVRHPKESMFGHIKDMIHLMKTQGPFQAVHAHTSHHEGLASLAARIAGIPYRVCHARTTGTPEAASFKKRIDFIIGRFLILTNATRLIAISREAGQYLFGTNAVQRGDVEIVADAIDLQPYRDIEQLDSHELRKQLGIPDCELLIGHVGNFRDCKNHALLIRLLKNIRDSGIDARLVLVGGGPLRSEIERQAIEAGLVAYVHFMGIRDDVPHIVKTLDVFVMPSIYEGLGGAALEAQAAGISCVLSSALPEIVDMGVGNVKFLSVNAPITQWVEAVIQQSKLERATYPTIHACFKKNGFLLENEYERMMHAYGLPMLCTNV